ncbi:MAG: enoyl-CoA hydratase/isomerase family protein [Candidatus Binataceae bacterium]|nr:enoyl-CoA hydratase/isomerase family protein [Candidatus Binataceae bacterium]
MNFKHLIFEPAPISILTINRPQALNALNREVLGEFLEVLHEVRREPSIRVLIVTGAGDRAFVAGADVAAMAAMTAIEIREFISAGHEVMNSIEQLPLPVIAAVNGFALGGGLELALACDLIVASDRARFGQPEVNLGLISGFGGTQRLPHRIGQNRAREVILTGDMFDAKTAFQWGLVSQVVAPAELISVARSRAEKIVQKSAIAIRQAKAAIAAASIMTEEAGLRFEQEAFGVMFASSDRVEGTKAFVEKRTPVWQHR